MSQHTALAPAAPPTGPRTLRGWRWLLASALLNTLVALALTLALVQDEGGPTHHEDVAQKVATGVDVAPRQGRVDEVLQAVCVRIHGYVMGHRRR